MITLDDVRRSATALSDVEDVNHFRLPSFKVRGKPFGEWTGVGPTAVFAASQEEAAAAVAEDHSVYEPVCRTAGTKVFVGVP